MRSLAWLLVISAVAALDNGLARTPVMGWLSWARFFCEIDCKKHPMTCINEKLYTDMADQMVSEGYLAAGYNQVNVDDCWMSKQRDPKTTQLVADPDRFPHGIKWLAKYMHDRGLKLGIYEDYGTKTCGGYPGSIDYLKVDADTFASWDIDMVKLDGCYADAKIMDKGYPEMEGYLNATGRKMIYSCSWPDYIRAELKIQPNYKLVAQYCNMWRNFDDISISWKSIASIISYYDHNQDILIPVHGPGHWNDPDMLVVGNSELTLDQARAQMTIWCMWSAPLLMSNDLRVVTNAMKDIMLNKLAIRVDQDPLGKMARLVANSTTGVGAYLKEMTPVKEGKYSYAIAFLNRNLDQKVQVTTVLKNLGLTNAAGYKVTNVWSGNTIGTLTPADSISANLPSTSADMWIAEVL